MTEPTKQRPGDQPLPSGGQECVQDRLVEMIRQRQQLGVQRYGQPLMTFNGRDAIRDALEEAVDLAAYLMQISMERDAQRTGKPEPVSPHTILGIDPDFTLDRDRDRAQEEIKRLHAELADAESAITDWATAVDQREQDASRLRKVLAEVLLQFTERGHPGEPCRRTGWVPVRTLNSWDAIFATSVRQATARQAAEETFAATQPRAAP